MADDTHEERFQQHEESLQSLAAMLAAQQHEMNKTNADGPGILGTNFGRILPGLFLLAWSAFMLPIDYQFVGMLSRDRTASGHPTVSAIITRSEVESKNDDERASQSTVTSSHPFKVLYHYEVNGREYAGDKFHHGMHAGGLKSARAIQARYPVGSRVSVHYNPDDPADSVIATGLRGADLLALLCMTPFNVVMLLGGWWWATEVVGGAPPFTGPVTRVSAADGEVRLRLAHCRPVAMFLLALGGASFGMGFVVMLLALGGGADITQMGFVWAVVLALAVGVSVWQARRIAAGGYDFRVDRLRGTLALPPFKSGRTVVTQSDEALFLRATVTEVALARIVDIRVASREDTDSEGDWTVVYYEPVVIYLDDVTGQEALVEVRTQTTEGHGKKIVGELRREVGLDARVALPSYVVCWKCKAQPSVTHQTAGKKVQCEQCGTQHWMRVFMWEG